ncbi:type I-U CRISPR-associated protein Cas7 [Nonomuraea longispora]|uniref:Type I-U CRISPR-associated protein Cas7 n=1 Tax=Nonomuraea longispora TaxID=1848320 RepID=A0A4V2XHQ0_9ACTN|nr:type I-U CRISPR-associated protein Cas7 [Nonomuraea longispora]TDB95855.1 type I-U CRISPR-associated protein Cas7 [Nonomuraea longispora]
MSAITLDTLLTATAPGGGSCLTSITELAPAGGPHSAVAPAKFAAPRGKESVYAYERRYLEGELRTAVIVDSKQSQLNRAEAGLALAIDDENPALSRMPRIVVTYEIDGQAQRFSDLTLPHRAYDGHIRAATRDGVPVTDLPEYRAIRDATPLNARALLEASPITLIYGGWDASRRARQGRWRSAMVGEIIGFCADGKPSLRGGARVDGVGMQMLLSGKDLREVVERQSGELSVRTADKLRKEADKATKDKTQISASAVGLGGIPPALDQLAGVACDRIIRSHVLSFATLRQMRFGAGPDGDQACRALLAALALNGLAPFSARRVD